MVDREEEIKLLLRRWERAKAGKDQVVLVSGEPGVGKSRLIRALRERLGNNGWMPLSHYCSPYHRTTALHPVIGLLERAAGFMRDDPPERRLAKLEALLGQATEEVEAVAPLFTALLAIPTGRHYPPLDISPQRLKQKTLEAFLAQLEGLAARRPVLVVYENVDWADPTLLELLDLVVDRVQDLPVLVIITFRPEFTPPWTDRAHVATLVLDRLDRHHGAMLAERVTTGGKALPPDLVEQIAAKTDGVPLFVEELTKAILESGLLKEEGDRYMLVGPLPPLAIPSTLHDSLLARLDRLALVREVAQIGAALGQEFSHELLAAVAPLRDDRLRAALDQLVEAELIFRHGTAPEARYVFKHALVRDVAYGTLLKSRRRQLHGRIVQALEERFPAMAATKPELLAQHCTEAGLAERAVEYWYHAGRLALARSSTAEAVAQLDGGLEVLASLPDGPERWRKELELRIALGGALIAAQGYAAPATGRAYIRARELCDRLGRSAKLFLVLRGLWNCHFVRGELQRALDLAERLAALAAEQGGPLPGALAQRALGSTLLFLSWLVEASEQLDRGIALGDAIEAAADSQTDLLLYAERPGAICRLYSARSLWLLGFPDRALATVQAGLALSGGPAHPHSLALNNAAVIHTCRREFDAALRQAETAAEVAREHRLLQWLAMASMSKGFALASLGRHAEGLAAQLRTGLADWNRTGARLDDTRWLGLAAAAHIAAGQLAEACATLDQAADAAAATGECYYEAELHRLRGLLLMVRGEEEDQVEEWFRRAITTARSCEAKSLKLRVSADLARLWRNQGKRRQAFDLVAAIYGWFTEGFDTPDLIEAKALLDELA